MSNDKQQPNNFKEASTSHIPADLIAKMNAEQQVRTDGMGIIESIQANIKKPIIQQPQVQQEQFHTVVVDGIALKVSTDPYKAIVVLMAYLLGTVWFKDPKVKKVLKAFNFSLSDANGTIVYPKGKKK